MLIALQRDMQAWIGPSSSIAVLWHYYEVRCVLCATFLLTGASCSATSHTSAPPPPSEAWFVSILHACVPISCHMRQAIDERLGLPAYAAATDGALGSVRGQ